ncbi:hypothetical protein AALA54_17470, partial [Oscillospiraceae bacterium 44-34]
LSKLFETTNPSGASCLSRCLIYKVHAARSAAGVILPHRSSLVKHFFQVFSSFFRARSQSRCGSVALAADFQFTTSPNLCQELFRLFSKFFVPASVGDVSTVLSSQTASI